MLYGGVLPLPHFFCFSKSPSPCRVAAPILIRRTHYRCLANRRSIVRKIKKKSDEAFIRDSTLRFGSRQAGSNTLAAQGWVAARAGQDDVAMRRFNQAWLLNPKNYSVFWGFGAMLSGKGKLSEALEYLETARELVNDPKQRVALLCDLGAVHSAYAARLPADRQLERAQQFVLANNRFTESLENDPTFAQSWREWAISLYDQERYSEAWIRVKKARELNAEPFPPEFLEKLSAKMPEPK